MGRKHLDFKELYESKIIGLDPGWGTEGGTGYAIINLDAECFGGRKNKPLVDECGIITTFACDSRLSTKEELCEKTIRIWNENSGFIKQPYLVVIEKPVIYPGSPVRYQTILDLSELVGMLGRCFKPRIKMSPFPKEWKGNVSKDVTQNTVLNELDFISKRIIANSLSGIHQKKHHNIFDAIGLSLYAAHVLKEEKQFPTNSYQVKN